MCEYLFEGVDDFKLIPNVALKSSVFDMIFYATLLKISAQRMNEILRNVFIKYVRNLTFGVPGTWEISTQKKYVAESQHVVNPISRELVIDSSGSLMCRWPGNGWKHATSGNGEPDEPFSLHPPGIWDSIEVGAFVERTK